MAGRVIWTIRAEKDLLEILEYWVDRTQAFTYSRKLNRLFKENVKFYYLSTLMQAEKLMTITYV